MSVREKKSRCSQRPGETLATHVLSLKPSGARVLHQVWGCRESRQQMGRCGQHERPYLKTGCLATILKMFHSSILISLITESLIMIYMTLTFFRNSD